MRKVVTKAFTAEDGTPLEVSVIENPSIEDVLVAEVQIYAFGVFTTNIDTERRVSRDVRNALIRFGVQ